MENLAEFALFAGKVVIVFAFIAALLILFAGFIMKQKMKPDLQIENLNHKLDELEHTLKSVVLHKKDLKKYEKLLKAKEKEREEQPDHKRKRIYCLDFEGDIKASAVDQLRDEITAILTLAQPGDEAVISIESPGGTVHGYGLAAAQILRLKNAGVTVVATIDRVAASGGYMMACTANKIIAAPFAIVGSIGVLAQVPNFHRLLKKNDVDYEEMSSGEYKRTVSVLGEITEKGRAKFLEQIVDTHTLFKDFVKSERQIVDINKVATGEYWYGVRAKELNLVDELITSDDYIFRQKDTADIFSVKITPKKTLSDKINDIVGLATDRVITKLENKVNVQPFL